MAEQLGVPLESLPPDMQALFDEAAKVYRSRLKLPDDAPLRVILPENPSEELKALLFSDSSFETSVEGFLDLGIERD